MSDVKLLAEELLKLDGLKSGEASKVLLEQIRLNQTKSEQRERFWFRMSCGFWIALGLLFLLDTLFNAVQAYFLWFDTHAFLPAFAVAMLGAIFSYVRLVLTRRQAGQATMQMTLAVLTNEIRDLKRQQEKRPANE